MYQRIVPTDLHIGQLNVGFVEVVVLGVGGGGGDAAQRGEGRLAARAPPGTARRVMQQGARNPLTALVQWHGAPREHDLAVQQWAFGTVCSQVPAAVRVWPVRCRGWAIPQYRSTTVKRRR